MAKELILDVVARKNSKDLQTLADEFDRLAKSTDESGKSLQKHATFTKYLDDQIAKTKVQVRQLGEEFDKTGSKDVFAKLRGAQSNLKSLEGISKQLATSVQTGVENGILQGVPYIGKVFGSLPPEAQAGIAAGLGVAIVAGSTAIGAAINAVLLSGIGLGGVAVGVVGQLHDPAVEKALGDLKTSASNALSDSTRAFAPVLVEAAHEFQDILLKAEPVLEKAFDKLAPHAEKVFQGLAAFGEKAAPGFLEALDAAGPILDELGRDLPGLGKAVSDFFHSLSQGAGGARDGLHSLLNVIGGVIQGTGYLIEGLSKGYEALAAFGDLLKGDVADAGARFNEVFHGGKGSADDFAHGLGATAKAAQDAASALERMNGQLSTLLGNQLSYDQANDKFKEDLLALADNLDKTSRSLDDSSAAGLHNRDVILGLIGDAQQARDAQIQMAGGANASKSAVDAANKTYEDAITQIEAMGVKAGLSKKDLDALAGTYYVNIIEAVQAINSSGLAQNVSPHDPNRKGNARASGGPVTAGVPYIVGENGPELMVPNVNGTIIPKLPASPSFVSTSAAGSGGTVVGLEVVGGADSAVGTLINGLLRVGALRLTVRNGVVVPG